MLQKERCFDITSWQNKKIMENTEIRENMENINQFFDDLDLDKFKVVQLMRFHKTSNC